jgi:hypothetical protein
LIAYGNTAGCARGRSVVRHVGRFFFLRSDLHQIFRNALPHDEKQAQKKVANSTPRRRSAGPVPGGVTRKRQIDPNFRPV